MNETNLSLTWQVAYKRKEVLETIVILVTEQNWVQTDPDRMEEAKWSKEWRGVIVGIQIGVFVIVMALTICIYKITR